MSIYRLQSYHGTTAHFEYYGALPVGERPAILLADITVGENFNLELPYDAIDVGSFVRVFAAKVTNHGQETKDSDRLRSIPQTDAGTATDTGTAATDEPVTGAAEDDASAVPEAERQHDRAIRRKRANLI
ncbi:MAG: hypothetical protein ACRCYP_02420 [Alphaproteobacteria bacterium]